MTPDAVPFSFADVCKWALSALAGVTVWVASVFHKRLDGQDANHTALAEKVRDVEFMSVGRDTYQAHVHDTHESFEKMRKESIAREDRIVAEIRSLGVRIDTLFRRPER